MFFFAGRYATSVRPDKRLTIPAIFRHALEEGGIDTIFITWGMETCLYLYPETEIQEIIRRIHDEMDSATKELEPHKTILKVMSNGRMLRMDESGRVCIPEPFYEYARLSGSVCIIGVGNRMEIWNPDLLEEFLSSGENFDDFGMWQS